MYSVELYMPVNDPHDRYFHKVMSINIVAQQLLQWFLPQYLKENLNFSTLNLDNGSYIDKKLNKSMSDVVFNCQYLHNSSSNTNNSKIIIFIEHQSTAQFLMPVRIYHYMFAMINKIIQSRDKKERNKPLPDIYPIVFYNGKTKRYPFSTKLIDCFENNFGVMNSFSQLNLQLININSLTRDETLTHGLAGIMTEAMKRSSVKQTQHNYMAILKKLAQLELQTAIPDGFTTTTIEYMMNVKHIDNLDQLIEQNMQLAISVRGEAMTIAEAFEARGKEAGLIEGKLAVANNLLKEGISVEIVVKTTGLTVEEVNQLISQNNE